MVQCFPHLDVIVILLFLTLMQIIFYCTGISCWLTAVQFTSVSQAKHWAERRWHSQSRGDGEHTAVGNMLHSVHIVCGWVITIYSFIFLCPWLCIWACRIHIKQGHREKCTRGEGSTPHRASRGEPQQPHSWLLFFVKLPCFWAAAPTLNIAPVQWQAVHCCWNGKCGVFFSPSALHRFWERLVAVWWE